MAQLKRKLESANASEAIDTSKRARPGTNETLSKGANRTHNEVQQPPPATPSFFSLPTATSASEPVIEREESPEHEPGTHFGTFTEFAKDKLKAQGQSGSKKPQRGQENQSRASRFGQSAALDIDVGSETSDQEAVEAALYLQSVRSEADGLPYLTRLQLEADIYENGLGDSRGYYADGAFVSAPVAGPVLPPGFASAGSDRSSVSGDAPESRRLPIIVPQKAYKASLIARYHRLHTFLSSPRSDAMARTFTKEEHLYTFPTKSQTAGRARTMRNWLDRFITRHPAPAQIACANAENVLELLSMIRFTFKPGKNLHANTSSWIWALLCRLDASDVRGSDEMHIIRELAFRALWVRCSFTGEKIPEVELKARDFALDNKETFEWLGVPLNKPPTKANRRKTLEAEKEKDQRSTQGGDEEANGKDKSSLENDDSKTYEMDDELKKLLSDRVEELRGNKDDQEQPPVGTNEKSVPSKQDANPGPEPKKQTTSEDDLQTPTVNTRTTLDMILFVASELFGQRDLTKYCENWDWDLYHLAELAADDEGGDDAMEGFDGEVDE
ncbi:uncharacterized protein J3D65DRAFT_624024 [Phyllosticta citribraziliensis]|uniref:Uncharacterized protein n=1 Tax=Phyllosticta citribraziliensis TaxID=989973 RepID=A0ABR1LP76_9PEZI